MKDVIQLHYGKCQIQCFWTQTKQQLPRLEVAANDEVPSSAMTSSIVIFHQVIMVSVQIHADGHLGNYCSFNKISRHSVQKQIKIQ